ncbi:EH domain-containing protein 1-like isoform X1 [Miscanthus floridulus]|uniref:EH domain-containing protein 1-like isoform X1 n=1 Tax=Miscanthus floridulus TaxID=154761 RepID=UPI003457C3AD
MGQDSSPKKWSLKEQRATYLQWFAVADEDGDGRLTGKDELRFFAMSNLSKPELKQVWAIADSKQQGYLGFYEFMTAMQLVSLAQAGNEISHDTLSSADLERLQPPTMEGLAKKLTSSDFDAKPMVMLLGQYSTGKTTFIKHLLKTSYPGAHIGPEPTTDRFVVITSGPDERCIPGNTIAVQADMPYSGLSSFGTAFLSMFECSQMPHPGRSSGRSVANISLELHLLAPDLPHR